MGKVKNNIDLSYKKEPATKESSYSVCRKTEGVRSKGELIKAMSQENGELNAPLSCVNLTVKSVLSKSEKCFVKFRCCYMRVMLNTKFRSVY